MLKSKFTILAVMTVLSTLIITGCYKKTPEQRAEHMVKHITATLKLDDAQTAKLEKIKDEFMARRPGTIKVREETMKEANELMKSPQIDQAKLQALIQKNQGLADDFVSFIFTKFTEIHDMLTPEQRDKLVAEIEKYAKH